MSRLPQEPCRTGFALQLVSLVFFTALAFGLDLDFTNGSIDFLKVLTCLNLLRVNPTLHFVCFWDPIVISLGEGM